MIIQDQTQHPDRQPGATGALAPAPAVPAWAAESVLSSKWSAEVVARGYTAVPDVLLIHMSQLGLTPSELVLLLQLMRYWWTANMLPYPSKRKLAQAIGCTEKNVQKVMKDLEAKGFVLRVQRRKNAMRSDSNKYCLDPLVAKLRALVASPPGASVPGMPAPGAMPAVPEAPMGEQGENYERGGPLARKVLFERRMAEVRARLGQK